MAQKPHFLSGNEFYQYSQLFLSPCFSFFPFLNFNFFVVHSRLQSMLDDFMFSRALVYREFGRLLTSTCRKIVPPIPIVLAQFAAIKKFYWISVALRGLSDGNCRHCSHSHLAVICLASANTPWPTLGLLECWTWALLNVCYIFVFATTFPHSLLSCCTNTRTVIICSCLLSPQWAHFEARVGTFCFQNCPFFFLSPLHMLKSFFFVLFKSPVGC